MKNKAWNKRQNKKSTVTISSPEKAADTVHYVSFEDWVANMEDFCSAILLPAVKDMIIRSWWINHHKQAMVLRMENSKYEQKVWLGKIKTKNVFGGALNG